MIAGTFDLILEMDIFKPIAKKETLHYLQVQEKMVADIFDLIMEMAMNQRI